MLLKSHAKYIRSLAQQKYRKLHNAYVAEGEKLAREWLESDAEILMVVGLESWLRQHEKLTARHPQAEVLTVTESQLASLSSLQTPNQVLVVARLPQEDASLPVEEWCLALDTIQDPGNMGTIIRIADWFGIRHVVCSPDCADAFAPKVVQAAMGGHLRVDVQKTDLESFIRNAEMPVIAATLSGENAYHVTSFEKGILLIGNESKGLSPELAAMATHQVTIPRKGGAESLNAAVSAGILCALLLPHA
jgi:TrmH family RNA methyltransferase